MPNQPGTLICTRCHRANAPGAIYCANCGEPISPKLRVDLSRMYSTLLELDEQIAAGHGAETVEGLRNTVRERYLALREPRPAANAPSMATIGVPAPQTTPLAQPAAAPVATLAPSPVVAPTPAQPHGPVFSWRAFIAEQAIAVMAYLGGFLLLIATLTFEVGGWQALPDLIKLAGVLIVYFVFGVLGFALRRASSLRTVSRVYLGVFALMTPLAALAIYRFELQAQGFSPSGMVCISAFYAAVVYLALAARTRFVTYAYLGWVAAMLGALAIPPFAAIDLWWEMFISGAMSLVLLAPHALKHRLTRPPEWLGALSLPALQIAIAAAVGSTLATVTFGAQVIGLPDTVTDTQRAAVAASTSVLVLVSLGWAWAARTFGERVNDELLQAIDWSVAGTVALATTAVATWLHASDTVEVYTLLATALVEGLAIELLPQIDRRRAGMYRGVQILAIVLVGIATLIAAPLSLPDAPLMIACLVGVALGLLFAMRGDLANVLPWGLVAGAFFLAEMVAAFRAMVPGNLLDSTADVHVVALTERPSLLCAVTLALIALGMGLRWATDESRLFRLRVPVQVTAVVSALLTAAALFGHTRYYAALLLGVIAFAWLLLARVERQPRIGVLVGLFGAVATVVAIALNADSWVVVAIPVAVAIVTVALGWLLERAYALPIYIVTLIATPLAFVEVVVVHGIGVSFGSTEELPSFGFGVAGWMVIVVALLLTVDAFRRSPGWMVGPAAVTLLCVFDARDPWMLVGLTFALAGVGLLLHWMRGVWWGGVWSIAAAVASVAALAWPTEITQGAAWRTVVVALAFSIAAYLIALQHRGSWLTLVAAPYALVALCSVGNLPLNNDWVLGITGAITLAYTLGGMAARKWLGRSWSPTLYGVAFVGVLITALRVTPYPAHAGLLEAILLGFAALAFFAALIEETPWAVIAPATLAAAAAFVQPDGRALLPLALAFAAFAYAISRTRGALWSLPLYATTMIAAVLAAWQGQNQSAGFELVTLVTLALAAWALAALESRAEALPVAFVFAALAVSSAAHAFNWNTWQATLTFAALAWVYEGARIGWVHLHWLSERATPWPDALHLPEEIAVAWRDPRRAGQIVSRGAAILAGGGAVIGGYFADQSFATHAAQTEAVTVALLSLVALLVRIGWGEHGWRPALYLAGEAFALAVTWQLRWLGATNVQAWILAPGSAQLIIGAFLPADTRLRASAWVSQVFSVAGALILLLPTLGQSVTEPLEWQWLYALLLALEALILTLAAVGLRNRVLAMTGAAFVGVAAIRGAIIAVQQNLPIPLVIAVVALALMGLATWLSLRARHATHTPTVTPIP
ncbi:MAG TPA: hypothetical protein VF792_06410 [Ktedonobacterales bacterium]